MLLVLLVTVAMASFAVGCGDNNEAGDPQTQTGAGAPDGAKGSEAGGAAVEAGKQRSEEDLANEDQNFSEEPPPVQIQSGNLSGLTVSRPMVKILRSKSEATKLQRQIYSGAAAKGKAPWASTDFKTRQFVVVFLPSSPPGTQLAISDVHQEGSKIMVKATRLKPGEGCKNGSGRANPWQAVETRQMKGEPELELDVHQSSAC